MFICKGRKKVGMQSFSFILIRNKHALIGLERRNTKILQSVVFFGLKKTQRCARGVQRRSLDEKPKEIKNKTPLWASLVKQLVIYIVLKRKEWENFVKEKKRFRGRREKNFGSRFWVTRE